MMKQRIWTEISKECGEVDVFKQRVIGFKAEPEPKTVHDAIIASMYKFGNIDLSYIAKKPGPE